MHHFIKSLSMNRGCQTASGFMTWPRYQPSPALPGRHRLHPCCVLLACAEAWRPAGAEGSRCCELESVTSITSVQSEPYTAHTAGPPPLPRGVNSRSQISRSARLIHHPFRAFVHSLSPSFRPAQSF